VRDFGSVSERGDNRTMTERGPHGTLRGMSRSDVGVPRPEGADATDATSGVVEKSHHPERGDQAREAVVQTIKKSRSSTIRQEKKVVIPSREAQTVKVRHEDVPGLAERIAEERRARDSGTTPDWVQEPAAAAVPEAAQPSPSWPRQEAEAHGTDWVDEPASFDGERVAPEAAPPSEEISVEPEGNRVGLWILLLLIATGAGVAAYMYWRPVPPPPQPEAAVEPAVEEEPAPAASTAEPQAPASAAEPVASAAPSASASATAPRPARPRTPPSSKLPPFPDLK
jgi:hypothetical protein